ncbi:MAG: helix-turn-helix domain-containing protein [Ruminococcus sp.]|nr:helix-turn-helix domain-containing protein [Ruminococcus sp.]
MITEFGKALRKLRIDRGEILKSMAEKLNMTSSYLSAIECGKRNIPTDLIQKLTSIYNLSEKEQQELSKARDQSLKSIEIELSANNICKRDLALQFARKFDDMDDELAIQILKFLNHSKEE